MVGVVERGTDTTSSLSGKKDTSPGDRRVRSGGSRPACRLRLGVSRTSRRGSLGLRFGRLGLRFGRLVLGVDSLLRRMERFART